MRAVGAVRETLYNPRYAGAYVYGRRRTITRPDGSTRASLLLRDEWTSLREADFVRWLTCVARNNMRDDLRRRRPVTSTRQIFRNPQWARVCGCPLARGFSMTCNPAARTLLCIVAVSLSMLAGSCAVSPTGVVDGQNSGTRNHANHHRFQCWTPRSTGGAACSVLALSLVCQRTTSGVIR